MKFHVGFSFRLKNIIKFLIPILIGIGAYFGIPTLFGYIRVNALVNTNTSYDLTIEENLSSTITDTYNTIIEDLSSSNSEYYDFAIVYRDSDTYVYVWDKLSYNSLYVYKEYSAIQFYLNNDRFYYLHFPTSYDILNSTNYIDFLDCFQTVQMGSSGCILDDGTSSTGEGSANPYIWVGSSFGNDDSYNGILSSYYYYISGNTYYYINSSNSSSQNVFYKTLYINDTLIEEGDIYPTYYSLFIVEPEPEPPTPSQGGIVDSIYWFYDNLTEYDVLVNIYVLLFLYCISTIILKLLMIVKGVKW